MDSNRSGSGDEQQRSAAGDRGREGFGDDGGARVGRPDTARGAEQGGGDASTGPSTQPVKEGLEGAILDDDDQGGGKERARTGATGAGNEAAQGIQAAQTDHAPEDTGGLTDPDSDQVGSRGGMDRRGSEPLEGRTREHEPNYGGKMGEPREG
jgi:hypothetical protein